jgi:anthranilate phosphoribosyltransferase
MILQEKTKEFGGKVTALINKQDLTRQDAKDMFSQVLSNEQPDLQQGAFLAALTAKGETAEEIAGAWEAIYHLDTAKAFPQISGPLVENCGTGMDGFKTFNISTAASVVAAANGIFMAKHGARALTSSCGAVDILEAVGVDVECDVDIVRRSIEQAGIGIFNGMSGKIHPNGLFRILAQIHFGTTLNIAASLANPASPTYAVRGVYRREMVEPAARVMHDIGYKKAIICFGLAGDNLGMDEFSTLGETFVAELDEKGNLTTYTVQPEDFGIIRPDQAALRPASSLKAEALNFVKILAGKDRGPKYDIVCLNAAPVLYITGRVKTLKEGYKLAQETVISGKAISKLKDWVKCQNADPESGLKKLDGLLRGISG